MIPHSAFLRFFLSLIYSIHPEEAENCHIGGARSIPGLHLEYNRTRGLGHLSTPRNHHHVIFFDVIFFLLKSQRLSFFS